MMGRRRKHRKDLPQRVYFNHGTYFFVDRKGKWNNLGRNYTKAMTLYAEKNGSPVSGDTMDAVIDRYLKEVSPKKSARTYQNHLQESKRLRAVFGKTNPEHITPQDIYKYMDAREAPIAANREVSLLSGVFKSAIRWGYISDNPCRLVSRNTERPREREVLAHEFKAVWCIAPEVIQCSMDIVELIGLRLTDLLRLNDREHVTSEGVYIKTGKTGKKMLYKWTLELKELHERCKRLRGNVVSMYWICNREGQPYTVSGFESIWQRVMNKAVEQGVISERFMFRDLRSRAGDKSDNATEFLGHDDPRTANRIYRRRPRQVTPNKPE